MINMQAMRSAVLEKHPWDHLSIDGVLDADVYDIVLELWPESMEQSEYKDRSWQFIYPAEDNGLWSEYGFWLELGKSFAESAELKSVVFDKLGIDESKSTYCEVRLITDTVGYAVKPHCDTGAKIVSMLLYCPQDDANIHQGTRLGAKPDKGDPLVLTKVEPFIPNHAFIFAQHPNYIHWVDPIKEQPDRHQILICWMNDDKV